MTMHSKEEIIKDEEQKEDHCSKASSDVSSGHQPYLNSEDKYKIWYRVGLENVTQRDEQKALLLDALKCDKSEVHSVYHFRDIISFYAFMTEEEADKFAKLEEVVLVRDCDPNLIRRKKGKSRRKKYIVPKIKKRKISTVACQILSERRKNREKWRYNEDMELQSKKIRESEEESEEESEDYCSDDSSGLSEWYKVSMVNDKKPEDHTALLQTTLNRGESEISYRYFGIHHLFEVYMTEEEADKVAGLEEVEFVEPRSSVAFLALD